MFSHSGLTALVAQFPARTENARPEQDMGKLQPFDAHPDNALAGIGQLGEAAFAQIDELKQHVARRFAEAAQIGSQVIAQQIESNRAQAQSTVTASVSDQGVPKQVETTSGKEKTSTESTKESSRSSRAVPA